MRKVSAMLNIDYTKEPFYTSPKPVKRRASKEYGPFRILQNIQSISAFAHNNAAIDSGGNLWTWGCDEIVRRGEVASYDFPPSVISLPRKRMEKTVAVSVGADRVYAITGDGRLWGWGRNRWGELGTGDKEPRTEPVVILDDVKSVSAGEVTLCIRGDGSLWGWGENEGLFPCEEDQAQRPCRIMDDVVQASCNTQTAMAITSDGTLWGWGAFITDKRIRYPIPLMEDMAWQSVPNADEGYALAITKGGDLYSFGISNYGSVTTWQVRVDDSLPIKVLANVEKVWAGHGVSFILMKDNSLLSSGNNGGGQCGIGRYSAPFHKPAYVMSDAKEAAVGWHHGMVLQGNGDLWIFGGQYRRKGTGGQGDG